VSPEIPSEVKPLLVDSFTFHVSAVHRSSAVFPKKFRGNPTFAAASRAIHTAKKRGFIRTQFRRAENQSRCSPPLLGWRKHSESHRECDSSWSRYEHLLSAPQKRSAMVASTNSRGEDESRCGGRDAKRIAKCVSSYREQTRFQETLPFPRKSHRSPSI